MMPRKIVGLTAIYLVDMC